MKGRVNPRAASPQMGTHCPPPMSPISLAPNKENFLGFAVPLAPQTKWKDAPRTVRSKVSNEVAPEEATAP